MICTSYRSSKVVSTQLSLFDDENEPLCADNGYVLDVREIGEGKEELSDDFVSRFLSGSRIIKKLKGDGDFRSPECIKYLRECDIVVTNPPFSLFREYVAQLFEYRKKFIIIGNQNAITYKEVFPLIRVPFKISVPALEVLSL